jgi:hypothetical protein
MDDRKLKEARAVAKKKGIKEEINISNAKNKRFAVIVDGKTINFGLYPFSGKGTFLDHKDEKIREAWRARHSKILKDGKPAYLNKNSPEYYSWSILWG